MSSTGSETGYCVFRPSSIHGTKWTVHQYQLPLPIAEQLSVVRSFYSPFSLTSWSFIFQILRGQSFSDPAFSGLAFSAPVSWSRIFQSCIFRSCIFQDPFYPYSACRTESSLTGADRQHGWVVQLQDTGASFHGELIRMLTRRSCIV